MNIFILDLDPTKCAEYMIDKHVIKMPLEHAQMLSTACRLSGLDVGYKATFKNHPCTKWARESKENFLFLQNLTLAIGEEYTRRYGKSHKSVELVRSLPVPDLPTLGITPFAQAMPIQYKRENAVEAYREYYKGEKRSFASWKHGRIPDWF